MVNSDVESSSENFTVEKAIDALHEILASLTSGNGNDALEEAREAVGNDMIGLMTRVFPLVTQITVDVISKYGFSPDGVGAIQFEHVIRNLEQNEPEIVRLHAQVRSYFLPAVIMQSNGSQGEN